MMTNRFLRLRTLVPLFAMLLVVLLLPCAMHSRIASAKKSSPPTLPALIESKTERDARMKWWREARFGMFIHWGLYAVPAGEYNGKRSDNIGEWIMEWANIPRADYEKFAPQFNPIKFNAAEWVRIAKEAGMKYIIINNRVGKGRQGMQGMSRTDREYSGDFGTPEQQIPVNGLPGVDWESCMTMNTTWGFKFYDDKWKSSKTIIRNLIDIASKGGNYLLNVGPTKEGLIPQPSVERLADVGRWMKVNGVSIYGTTASPFAKQLSFGRATSKAGLVYLHVFSWPSDGKLEVPTWGTAVRKAYLLSSPKLALKMNQSGDTISIELPTKAPDAIASVIVLDSEKK